jgi:rod shape-determining protein MreC
MKAVLPAPKSAWIALAAALTAHVLLISLAATHKLENSFLRVWLLEGLAPLEKLVDRSIGGVRSFWDNYVDLRNLREENSILRADNKKLRLLRFEWREDILEVARLRRALEFAESGFDRSVVARVIGMDASPGRQTVRIDRGKSSGIAINHSVVTPDGVAGRVIVASPNVSIVQTLIDPDSAVGVLIGDGRQRALAKGNGSRYLELDYIREDDSALNEGDMVVTSGLDSVHQKGLPVGRIISIGPPDDGAHFRKVFIETSVDFGRLEEVLCILRPASVSAEDDSAAPAPLPGDPAR